MKINESTFNQAVNVATAFIVNGDFRCGGSTRDTSPAMVQLHDMITTAYQVIEQAKESLESSS